MPWPDVMCAELELEELARLAEAEGTAGKEEGRGAEAGSDKVRLCIML